MGVPYDVFTNAFLSKVTEYDFINLDEYDRTKIVDGYMKRAIAEFKNICLYDLTTTADDAVREFSVKIAIDDMDELIDIISEGMVVQWMKPYIYKQDILENVLSTRDFTTYSPAELLYRVRESYNSAKRDFTSMMRDYSYNHGDLTVLHL